MQRSMLELAILMAVAVPSTTGAETTPRYVLLLRDGTRLEGRATDRLARAQCLAPA